MNLWIEVEAGGGLYEHIHAVGIFSSFLSCQMRKASIEVPVIKSFYLTSTLK